MIFLRRLSRHIICPARFNLYRRILASQNRGPAWPNRHILSNPPRHVRPCRRHAALDRGLAQSGEGLGLGRVVQAVRYHGDSMSWCRGASAPTPIIFLSLILVCDRLLVLCQQRFVLLQQLDTLRECESAGNLLKITVDFFRFNVDCLEKKCFAGK